MTSFYCHGPDLGTIPSCLDYYNRILTGSVSASSPASCWSIPHYPHLHHTASHYIIIATVNLLKGKSNHYHSLLKTSLALHVTQNKRQNAYHDLWSSAWSGLLFPLWPHLLGLLSFLPGPMSCPLPQTPYLPPPVSGSTGLLSAWKSSLLNIASYLPSYKNILLLCAAQLSILPSIQPCSPHNSLPYLIFFSNSYHGLTC